MWPLPMRAFVTCFYGCMSNVELQQITKQKRHKKMSTTGRTTVPMMWRTFFYTICSMNGKLETRIP